MQCRAVDLDRDYDRLLAMQRLNWEINFPGQALSEDALRGSLRVAVQRGDVCVYEEAGELVGWLWLDWHDAVAGHIRHIQVEQAHWGRGVGRALLEDAVKLCVARGRRALTLTVTKSNARAMALYAHMGFVVVRDEAARQRMRLELVHD
jgi:ribosomal protein S18 acetylase RimI-like enzyme